MTEISYRRHRFPPAITQHAVWLYLRFTLSYRDVEELLAVVRRSLSQPKPAPISTRSVGSRRECR
jgi:transposase-like protein